MQFMLEEKNSLPNSYMKPHPLLHTGSCTVGRIKPGIATLEEIRKGFRKLISYKPVIPIVVSNPKEIEIDND